LGEKPPEIVIVATLAMRAMKRMSAIYRTGCSLKLSTWDLNLAKPVNREPHDYRYEVYSIACVVKRQEN
jgi:hypothetical protein